MNLHRRGIPAGVLALAAACTTNGVGDAGIPVDATEAPMEPIVYEVYSGIASRRRDVITTRAEWQAFWNELMATRTPRPALPAVDFDRETVLVAAMGRQPTGGYAIEIEQVYRAPDEVVAVVAETRPGEGCMTAQAITAPVFVARIERAGLPIRFVETERVQDCD
ncbi:MAG TPA: protease complex subunit PrcB family protein [Longimicrobiales bacterium]